MANRNSGASSSSSAAVLVGGAVVATTCVTLTAAALSPYLSSLIRKDNKKKNAACNTAEQWLSALAETLTLPLLLSSSSRIECGGFSSSSHDDDAVLSPNGKYLVYLALSPDDNGAINICVRPVDETKARMLTSNKEKLEIKCLTWTRDSRTVLYMQQQQQHQVKRGKYLPCAVSIEDGKEKELEIVHEEERAINENSGDLASDHICVRIQGTSSDDKYHCNLTSGTLVLAYATDPTHSHHQGLQLEVESDTDEEDSDTDDESFTDKEDSDTDEEYSTSDDEDSDKENCLVFRTSSRCIDQEQLQTDSLFVGETISMVGTIHFMTCNYEKAIQAYFQARDILINHLGKDHLNVATKYSHLGDVYLICKDQDSALAQYRDALQIRWKHLDEHNVKVMELLEKIALVEMEQMEEAQRLVWASIESGEYGASVEDDKEDEEWLWAPKTIDSLHDKVRQNKRDLKYIRNRWEGCSKMNQNIKMVLDGIVLIEESDLDETKQISLSSWENCGNTFISDGEYDTDGVTLGELDTLREEVTEDMNHLDNVKRQLAIDMVKEKLNIIRETRAMEANGDENNKSRSCPSSQGGPLSPSDRADALVNVKERLEKVRQLREQRSSKSTTKRAE